MPQQASETLLFKTQAAPQDISRQRSVGEGHKYNILYILVDDVSVDLLNAYSDTSFLQRMGFGSVPNRPTLTNINTLIANRGVQFNNCFTMPVCSSHRACALTGRYPTRHGCGAVAMPHHAGVKFDDLGGTWSDEYTVAHLLNDAGYRTLLCGKAHLALQNDIVGDLEFPKSDGYTVMGSGWMHPITTLGFTEFRGTLRNLNKWDEVPPDNGIAAGYFNFYWNELRADGPTNPGDSSSPAPAGPADPSDPTNPNTSRQQIQNRHATKYSRARLSDWINNPHVDDAGKPWFACWALNAAHSPFGDRSTPQASGCGPNDNTDNVHVTGRPMSTEAWASAYGAIENIDIQIDTLRTEIGADVFDNTMIFFMSDNGSDQVVMDSVVDPSEHNQGTAYGTYKTDVIDQERLKTTVYSGGTRAALLVAGPLVREAEGSGGRVSESMVDSVDLFETFRQIAYATTDAIPGASERPNDSISFYDILRGTDVEDASANIRTWGFSQYFTPNGSSKAIVDTADTGIGSLAISHAKDYVYRKFMTTGGNAALYGQYHLVRRLVGTAFVDELYQINNYPTQTNFGIPVDYHEQTDLSANSTYSGVLVDMQADLDALITDMEDDPTHLTS